jgi:hypothetical protein
MNENLRLLVVTTALQDLQYARLRHGEESTQYERQLERSLGFIRGSLEHILMAALPRLQEDARGANERDRIG